MAISYVWSIVGLTFAYVTFKLLRFGRREKHLPPGPPTYPLVGNAHLAVDPNLYKKLRDWSIQYGPVFSLKIGKGTMIVLNSRKAVYDLIDKRSAIYSARAEDPQFKTALKGENIANMDADEGWRSQRKLTARFLTPSKLDGDLGQISEAEVTTLMHDLLTSPQNFSKHIERSNGSFSAIALYGQRAKTPDDFWVTGVYEAMDIMNKAISPGTYLPTEQFPIFNYVPKSLTAAAHKRAEDSYSFGTNLWTEAQKRVEARRAQGDERESLMDNLLSGAIKPDVPLSGTALANFVGALMQAAADTGTLTMNANIMFLAKHPWVQDKAQKELDALCGTERVPTWSDFKDLPYINCIVKEGLRIRPVTPIGIPHRVTQDDWYEGMLIPKDATIVIPHWALGHTPPYPGYEGPDVDEYNPDRYLEHKGLADGYAASADFGKRDHYGYGAGRRICAGIQLAERTQWRMLARLLWAFRLEEDPEAPIDTEAFEDKLITGPKPFKCRFVPRSEKHVETIKREMERSREVLEKWE